MKRIGVVLSVVLALMTSAAVAQSVDVSLQTFHPASVEVGQPVSLSEVLIGGIDTAHLDEGSVNLQGLTSCDNVASSVTEADGTPVIGVTSSLVCGTDPTGKSATVFVSGNIQPSETIAVTVTAPTFQVGVLTYRSISYLEQGGAAYSLLDNGVIFVTPSPNQ